MSPSDETEPLPGQQSPDPELIPEQVTQFAAAIITQYAGPLPPPEIVRQFEMLEPGAAKSILKLTEKQTNHRIETESKVIDHDIHQSRIGLWLGFVMSMILIIGGFITINFGHDTAGTVVIGSNLFGIMAIFVLGLRSRDRARASVHQTTSLHLPHRTQK